MNFFNSLFKGEGLSPYPVDASVVLIMYEWPSWLGTANIRHITRVANERQLPQYMIHRSCPKKLEKLNILSWYIFSI